MWDDTSRRLCLAADAEEWTKEVLVCSVCRAVCLPSLQFGDAVDTTVFVAAVAPSEGPAQNLVSRHGVPQVASVVAKISLYRR